MQWENMHLFADIIKGVPLEGGKIVLLKWSHLQRRLTWMLLEVDGIVENK